MDETLNNSSRAELVQVDESTSSSDDDDDCVSPPVIQVPPSHFSHVSVENSTNVHFGNSAVYNGDVTVIMSPAADDFVAEHIRDKGLLAVTSGLRTNFEDDEKRRCEAVNRILSGAPLANKQPDPHKIAPSSTKKRPVKKLIAVVVTLLIIISLSTALIFIWVQKLNTARSDDYDYSDYENANNFINGTEGSAPYYTRIDWLAQPVKILEPLKHPVTYYIVSHSATNPCFNHSQCVLQMRKMQMYHIESFGWADIGYNFVVGGDGGVYEGRGWDKIGAHAKGYNNVSIGLNFIGTFIDVMPTTAQMRAARLLMEEGVRLGKVHRDYRLIAHRQVSSTESPGLRLFKELQTWKNWYQFVDLPPLPSVKS